MRRTIGLLSSTALAFSLQITPSHAYFRGSVSTGGAPTGCPNLAFIAKDGCEGAPPYDALATALSFKNPNAFTDGSIAQTPGFPFGASPSQFNWNVAWKDYALGVDTSKGPWCGATGAPCSTTTGTRNYLVNAWDYNWKADPLHVCNYTGAVTAVTDYLDGSKKVTCKIVGTTSLNGFDVSPSSCNGGGYTDCCVQIIFQDYGNTGGTLNIANSRIKQPKNGGGCTALNRWGLIGGYAYIISADFSAHPDHPWNVNVLNNVIDQDITISHSLTDHTQQAGTPGTGLVNINVNGHAVVQYNWFGNSTGRVVNMNFCKGADFSYNGYVPSAGFPDEAHSEIPFFNFGTNTSCGNAGQSTWSVDYFKQVNNMIVSPYNVSGKNWTALSWVNLGSSQTMNVAVGDFSLNIFASNLVRPNNDFYVVGNAGNGSANICYDNVTGVCAGSGGATSGVYTNGDILTATIPGASKNMTVRLWGTLSGASTAEFWDGPDATSNLGTSTWYATSCLSCAATPSGAVVQINNGGLNLWNQTTTGSNGMIGFSANNGSLIHYASFTAQNNAFYAPTGSVTTSSGQGAYITTVPNPVVNTRLCADAMNFSGNFDIGNGSAVTWWKSNPIPAC